MVHSHQVLKNINLEITKARLLLYADRAEQVKSTLLRTINKLEPIDDGEIIVDSRYLSTLEQTLRAKG